MLRLCVVLTLLTAATARAATLQVGPARTYTTVSAAAAAANDNDVIEIDAGEYAGDVTNWTANGLTIRGVGGFAHLRANGAQWGGKGIWVIQGDDTVVEWIEFSEASVVDENGAGIRQEGTNLTVRNCYFHDNENGILAGADAASHILIEYSHFDSNGFGDGYTHNLYIGHVGVLTFQYNTTHHAHVGHNLKSRAHVNYVLYNRIMDEASGDASRAIDLPNGGESYVIGNVIQQGPNTENSGMFCFACEGDSNPTNSLHVINNTFVNDRHTGTFVDNRSSITAVVTNNIFVGDGTYVSGNAIESHNLEVSSDPGFRAIASYDYRLTSSATAAIDQGTDPGSAGSLGDLTPLWHYVHPADRAARPVVGALDIGAYELASATDGGPAGDPLSPGDPVSPGDPWSSGDPGTSAGDPVRPGDPLPGDSVSGDPSPSGDSGATGDVTTNDPGTNVLTGGCSCGAFSAPVWLAVLALRRRR